MAIKVDLVRFQGGGIFTKFTPPVWYAYVEGVGAPAPAAFAPPAGGSGGAAPTGGTKTKPGHTGPSGKQPAPARSNTGPSSVGGKVSRQEVLDRGRYWTNKGVPYSMSGYTTDAQGRTYRTDCSGLVSMALHADKSYSTVTLPEITHPIPKSELKPGDIVGNLGPRTGGAGGHVVIFNGWTDASQTSFRTIEHTPPRAVERTVRWGSANWNSQGYRYNNIVD